MKKAIISLIITSIIFMPGCYDPGNTAKVRIKLNNIPASAYTPKKHLIDRVLEFFSSEAYAQVPDTINKLYIAAFGGDSPLAVTDITDLNYTASTVNIEIDVPAGADRKIVVLAEDESGIIIYYGKNNTPLDLAAGDETSVDITMTAMYSALNARWNSALSRKEWDKIVGASGYNIYDSTRTNLLWSTTDTFYPVNQWTEYNWEIEFSFIDKKSEMIYVSY